MGAQDSGIGSGACIEGALRGRLEGIAGGNHDRPIEGMEV